MYKKGLSNKNCDYRICVATKKASECYYISNVGLFIYLVVPFTQVLFFKPHLLLLCYYALTHRCTVCAVCDANGGSGSCAYGSVRAG